MITEDTIGFFEQRELLFSSMPEDSLSEIIYMVSADGNVIYRTPLTQKSIEPNAGVRIRSNADSYYVNRYRAQSESAFSEALANPGVPVVYNIDILKSDGSFIHVESTHTNMLHLKEVNAILVIDRVITPASVAEKKMKENEETFRLLVESITEYAIYMMDPDGIILSWNQGAEQIMGYTAKEIIGKDFSVFYTSEDIASLLPTRQLLLTKQNGRYENIGWRVRKKGSLFWADESFSALYGTGMNLRGYIKVTRNITERKLFEEKAQVMNDELKERRERRDLQLQQAHKELEAFSYSVSHDLRAPLRAVSGFATILQEDYSSLLDEEGNRILNKIITNSNRMGELIDDLLAFSRMGRLDIKSQTINMQVLAESSLEELLPEKIKSKYEVVIEQLPACMGDNSMMKQVWMNLIENAIKYSSRNEKPRIEISYKEEKNMHVYSVSDNGVGFDMQYAGKLFGVFQRLHHPEQFEGTGLGLALVQRIIHKHNGDIWAEAAPNKGAIFSFKLPK